LEKGINLILTFDEDVPHGIKGDVTRFKQIMINLVTNAIKFTHEGSVNLIITQTKIGERTHRIKMAVKDSGIGISMEDQERIFQSFSQVDPSTTRKYGGTGLGLAICSTLAKMMKGELWFESEAGVGTTFFFEFSVESIDIKNTALIEDENQNQNSKESLQILIAEDNKLNQVLAVKFIEKLGHKTEIADNGEIAIQKLKENHFDVIFMDMQMPIMDGIEAIKKIVEIWGKKRPRIIAMTVNVMPEDKNKCYDAGMDDFVAKPIIKQELALALSKCRKITPMQTSGPSLEPNKNSK